MATRLYLHNFKSFHSSRSFKSKNRERTESGVPNLPKLNGMRSGNSFFRKYNFSLLSLIGHYNSSRSVSSRALSEMAASASLGEKDSANEVTVVETDNNRMEFNRVNCLVWVLHESAESFSLAVDSLELPGSGAELAMAWNGKDVHGWHKRIAYQVVVYALLKMAIEVEILLSHDRHNNPFPVKELLIPKINLMGEHIESQLKMKHPELVQWFREVELPRISCFFAPLLKKWSMEYAGSGVAGIIVAISCCAAVEKLGSSKISCLLLTFSLGDVLVELMDLSHSLVEVGKLHKLATEAGFELDFLTYFGAKVLPCNNIEDLEFWIGLAQQKLSEAFNEELVIRGIQTSKGKLQAEILATLGLFAYLGRKTRSYLSKVGINDLDELVKDFLSYLECGSIFIYPELASVSAYQCFMDVVVDGIGWLDFYDQPSCLSNHERKRSKHHTIQAEKEMILSSVLTACYDVFSGFAHFSRSNQQPLDVDLLTFLLRSQSLLTICLEDHWVIYRSREPLKTVETASSDLVPPVGTKGPDKLSVVLEPPQKPRELLLKGCLRTKSQEGADLKKTSNFAEAEDTSFLDAPLQQSLFRKYSLKVASTGSDLWMGTQLLFVDIMVSVELLLMQLRGHKGTKWERSKIKRTLNDIATLIPVTILMLLPVSAVGHAAMLAAIQKYMPSLIPSPYSSERLDVIKQLKRTKKMEMRSWGNLEDSSSRLNLEDPSARMP